MNGKDIYEHIKDMDKTAKTIYLKKLTEEGRKLYKNFMNAKSQAEHRQKFTKEKHEEDKATRAKMMRELRAKEVDKYKLKNKEHNKAYYAKQKREEAIINVTDILNNDIIDKVPELKIVNGELVKKRGRKQLTAEQKKKTAERRKELRAMVKAKAKS